MHCTNVDGCKNSVKKSCNFKIRSVNLKNVNLWPSSILTCCVLWFNCPKRLIENYRLINNSGTVLQYHGHYFAFVVQTSASSRIHVFITLFDVKFSFPHKLDSHGGHVGVVFVVLVVFILVVFMLMEILLSLLSAILVDVVMPRCVVMPCCVVMPRCGVLRFRGTIIS